MQVASPANLAAQAQAELITQPLYSTMTVKTLDPSTAFFNGTDAGNRLLTNVDQNGVLPHPKFFRIGGFRLVPDHMLAAGVIPAAANQIADMLGLITDGWYEFKIGDLKPYLQVPNAFLPGGIGPVVRAADPKFFSVSNGDSLFTNFLRIKHWISIPPLQSFQATCTWNEVGGIVLKAPQKLTNYLDGEYGREVL